jgi:hypothetical protein
MVAAVVPVATVGIVAAGLLVQAVVGLPVRVAVDLLVPVVALAVSVLAAVPVVWVPVAAR